MPAEFAGLVAAPFTPFTDDGDLALDRVGALADHLAHAGVRGVFVAGSTGEGPSLTFEERRDLFGAWAREGRRRGLEVVANVGGDCVLDGARLARSAAAAGVDGIGAQAPSYYGVDEEEALAEVLEAYGREAPGLPLLYYDIPALTGVAVDPDRLLAACAERVPTLAGVKCTRDDLAVLRRYLAWGGGRLRVLYGNDESLLAGVALGVHGAVGSTYNLAAPLYEDMLARWHGGDAEGARALQDHSVQLVATLARRGFLPSAKAAMELVGVPCGPVRLPFRPPSAAERASLERELRAIGFFDWGAAELG